MTASIVANQLPAVGEFIPIIKIESIFTGNACQLPVPALAVVCFAVAQWLGGSGFIAYFVGGMLFGGLEKSSKHKLLLAAEGTGDTLALITWVIFGAAVVGQSVGSFNWQVVVYALLSLTVVRMFRYFCPFRDKPGNR